MTLEETPTAVTVHKKMLKKINRDCALGKITRAQALKAIDDVTREAISFLTSQLT